MNKNRSTLLWEYFEKSDNINKIATCNYCTKQLSYKTTITNLKSHLKLKHPYMYDSFMNATERTAAIFEKFEEVESDQGDHDTLGDDNQFTEVFYVEEKPKPSPQRTYTPKIPKMKYKRSKSDSSDEIPIKKTKNAPDELDSFLQYIKCLLLQTSPELSAKLQMEVVNMIMKAKLNETRHNFSISTPLSMSQTIEENVIVSEVPSTNGTSDQEIS